jgi:translation initiation factor 1A
MKWNYKKKKKGGESEKAVVIDRLEGQQIARVIKVLGNCNVQCYCNDNAVRICHIRGGMQKKVWINIGDIILISLRGDTGIEEGKERGDVLARYDPRVLSKLKKEEDVNPKLFLQLENSDGHVLEKIKELKEDDGFEFEAAEADLESEESGDESSELDIAGI